MLRTVWLVKAPAPAGHVEEVAPAIGLAAQVPTHAGTGEWLAFEVLAKAAPGLTRAAAVTAAIAIRARVNLKRGRSRFTDNGHSFRVAGGFVGAAVRIQAKPCCAQAPLKGGSGQERDILCHCLVTFETASSGSQAANAR